MATTQQVNIKDILKQLEDGELKELKDFFSEHERLPKQIPYAVLDQLDRLDTGRKIKQTYGADSLKYIMMGLEQSDRKDLVEKFSHAVSAPKRNEASTSHFVDQHRVDLIKRVKMVDSILDLLLAEGVITHEGLSNVRSKPTSMEKMRELYELLDSSGTKAKQIFYKGLEENEQFLLQDLVTPDQHEDTDVEPLLPSSSSTYTSIEVSETEDETRCKIGGSLLCATTGTILLVVTTATDYWVQYTGDDTSYCHSGMWRGYCCNGTTCHNLRNQQNATQLKAMGFFLLLNGLLCIIGIIIGIKSSIQRSKPSFAAGIMFLLPTFVIVLIMSIYTGMTATNFNKIPDSDWGFSWSYMVCWMAPGWTFFAGFFMFYAYYWGY